MAGVVALSRTAYPNRLIAKMVRQLLSRWLRFVGEARLKGGPGL